MQIQIWIQISTHPFLPGSTSLRGVSTFPEDRLFPCVGLGQQPGGGGWQSSADQRLLSEEFSLVQDTALLTSASPLMQDWASSLGVVSRRAVVKRRGDTRSPGKVTVS